MKTRKIAAVTVRSLPEEIVVEILLRLPARSLLKFRCICKSWCCLISSQRFIESHLKIYGENTSFTGQRIIFTCPNPSDTSDIIKHCSLNSVLSGVVAESVGLKFPIKKLDLLDIVGTCDGLICWAVNCHYFCLWNPSTRKFKILPELNDGVNPTVIEMHGFGFGLGEFNKDYKVVVSGCRWSLDGFERMMKVYSLKSDSWKSVEVPEHDLPSDVGGKFVGGKLHWGRSTGSSSRPEIDSFNLTSEVWGKIELPNDYGGQFSSSLGVLGGCLCVQCDFGGIGFDVWVLKQHGLKESWEKVFRIPYPVWLSQLTPLCIGPNGRVLLLRMLGQSFMKYDAKKNFVDPAKIVGCDYFSQADIYVESLVSLHE